MIHLSKVPQIMEKCDRKGKPVPFTLKYVKKSTGQVIAIDNAVLTSSYHLGSVNIRILASGEIRKILIPLIIEFNHVKTFL